ncbi:MAG: hypothetical protein OER88_07160 [Planctomycetota bacterium]|nr:hypothetical protein [Planctomycetota bacterium]
MTKRNEALLVGLLLVGCIAGIVFVFSMLTESGAAFDMEEEAAERAAAPEPPPPVKVSPPPQDPLPQPEPEPAAVDAEPAKAAAPESTDEIEPEPSFDGVLAQLTIELLTPAEESDRDITVRVIDREGVPIDDVLVVFRDGPTLMFRQRSSNDGNVVFSPYATERGPFRIDAVAHGYEPATAPEVKPGATTELTLVPRASIYGVVRAPSKGQGLVRLFTEYGQRELKLDADGGFRFDDLDEGYVTVEADVPPYGTKQESFYLRAGSVQRVLLRVREKSRIPIRGKIRMWPRGVSGKMWINGIAVPVLASGSYTFKEAVEGLNEVLIDVKERALFRERFTVKAQQKSNAYNFRLNPEAKLRGTVSDAKRRKRIAGAEVRIGIDLADRRNEAGKYFPVDRIPVVKTDSNGVYEIGRLDGRLLYKVAVVKQGFGLFYGEAVPSPGTTLHPVLPEGPFLFGRLRGLGGVPKNAVVTARPLEAQPERLRFNVADWNIAKSGRDHKGFYGLSGLLPGSYLIRVDAPDYGAMETVMDFGIDQRRRIDLRLRRNRDLEDDDADLLERLPPVIQAPDETLPPPSDATILRIDADRGEDKEPFPGVRIVFYEEELEFAPPMEFFEDSFEIVGMPEADYRAVLTHPALKKPIVKERIRVRRGEVAEIALR